MIACAGLTVPNSGTSDVTGTTGETETVICNAGYATVNGATTYTATCSASTTAPGASEWTGVEACVGIFFIYVVILEPAYGVNAYEGIVACGPLYDILLQIVYDAGVFHL